MHTAKEIRAELSRQFELNNIATTKKNLDKAQHGYMVQCGFETDCEDAVNSAFNLDPK